MFPTDAFATATRRKVLRTLAEKNKRYTIAELAEMCHRSEASISRAVRDADRYPFIERDHVPGSKQLTFRLDPDSQYTTSIRNFFGVERERERQSGTVPVDIWNLLEDIARKLENQVEGFVELFLFGSYATGEYYSGSDIDLLLVSTSDGTSEILRIVAKLGDERLQVIPVLIDGSQRGEMDDETILAAVREQSPLTGADVVLPLTGEVDA